MSSGIRIAFVAHNFAPGGAQRVMFTLLRHLDRSSFDPILITLSGEGELGFSMPRDLEIVDLKQARLSRASLSLARTLRQLNCEVVFSSIWHLNVYLASVRWLIGRPALVIREANMPDFNIAALPAWLRPAWAYAALYPRCNAVIASSEMMAKKLAAVSPGVAERLHVINNPVDIERIRSAARRPERISGGGRRFVAVGRLHIQKGFDRLLSAFSTTHADDILTVIGDGPERQALEQQAKDLGIADRTRFVGRLSEPAPLTAGADVLVMTSRWEGMPNVALEALALGTPVIATRESGAIAELAAQATPDTVSVVADDAALADAMRAIPARSSESLRPALLPASFEAKTVTAAFEHVFRGAAAGT